MLGFLCIIVLFSNLNKGSQSMFLGFLFHMIKNFGTNVVYLSVHGSRGEYTNKEEHVRATVEGGKTSKPY